MSLRATAVAAETDEKQQDATVQDATVPRDDDVPSWRIFVKTVGKGFDNCHTNDDGIENKGSNVTCVDGSLSFHVNVSPEDGIDLLHGEIEDITGVKASQQRLIYRGRLIGKSDVEPASQNGSTANNGSANIDNSSVVCKDKSGQNLLAPSTNEPQHDYKIKDIAGLCDGQTIHLVKKRDTERTRSNSNGTSDVAETDGSGSSTSNDANRDTEASSGSGGALLAALLGLETRFPEDTGSSAIGPPSPERRMSRNNNTSSQTATPTTGSSMSPPWRSSRTADADNDTNMTRRSTRAQSRRAHYRLGDEELEVGDPGSMESVRQGLMTLNTIMNSQPHRRSDRRGGGNIDHPLEVNREWFRGQWIDARDTVNQWLEATVVDILDPYDVLNETEAFRNATSSATFISRYGTPENPHQPPRQRPVPNIDNDPAISANDVEGRRRLLLEECEPGDPREITFDSNTDQASFQLPNASRSLRPRASNNGVKLLLIHYNGWPHRWDEWIRSDSERLRPFRTRTRHPNNSSMASPTPQSIFNESPRTNISEHGSEEADRFAVLPELNIALSRVSELLGELVQRDRGRNDGNETKDDDDDELEDLQPSTAESPSESILTHQRARADLPWVARGSSNTNTPGENQNTLSTVTEFLDEEADAEEDPSTDVPVPTSASDYNRNSGFTTSYNQAELRNLATMFDRLGRTLTDAAPHIASIAASLPAQEHSISLESDGQNESTPESPSSLEVDSPSPSLGGLLSLWPRERERMRRNRAVEENVMTRPSTSSAPVDPDHLDFASGVVNTTRGQVRSGPRSRSSHQDDVASLLGTYLAAASLGSAGSSNDESGSGATSSLARLLARGSNGGSGDSGIDIHIHAIVTTPGASPGGMGIATLSSGRSSPTTTLGGARNLFSSNRSTSIRSDEGGMRGGSSPSSFVEPRDEEYDNGLFSELYSESPTPIDPNGSPAQRESNSYESFAADRSANDGDTANNFSTSNRVENNEQFESSGDTSVVTPTSNRSRSSPRRNGTGRRSGVFRLFGRRRSRADNPDRSNNEDA